MFTSLLLIDADSIYFKACMATQKQNDIRRAIDGKMRDIKRFCGTDEVQVAVKGRGNFRKDLYPLYKKNRREQPQEIKEALTYGHNYMVEKHNAVMADGMEADDLVSIWANEAREMDIDYTIVGIDKDLLQIPGWHVNFDKLRDEHVRYMDDDAANYQLMLQCLTGDSTDNIPGIKGIGPKKASVILQGIKQERRWKRVKASWRFHKAGDPTVSRRLLEMLTTWEEYDTIRTELESKTSECKRNDGEEQDLQDSSV